MGEHPHPHFTDEETEAQGTEALVGLLCCLCRCIIQSQQLPQSLRPAGLLKAPGLGAGEGGGSSQPLRGHQGSREGLMVPLPGLPLTGHLPAHPTWR